MSKKDFGALKEMDTVTLNQLVNNAKSELMRRQKSALHAMFNKYDASLPRPVANKLDVIVHAGNWDVASDVIRNCGKILTNAGLAFNLHTVSSNGEPPKDVHIIVPGVPVCLQEPTELMEEDDVLNSAELRDLLK
jgi:hypothetical protein